MSEKPNTANDEKQIIFILSLLDGNFNILV